MNLKPISRLLSCDRGGALVEFVMTLPLLLLTTAVIVDGGRIFWSYQSAVQAVRDATRFVGRSVPSDVCVNWSSLADYPYYSHLMGRVEDTISDRGVFFSNDANLNDVAIRAGDVTIDAVSAEIATAGATGCPSEAGSLRVPRVAVATVTADVTIPIPFLHVMALFGDAPAPSISTTITDRTRIFGS